MKSRINIAVLAACAALISGCGGGGDDSPSTSTGVFVDSATQGLAYTCGSTTGVTDAAGTFNFVAGDTCTFKVGDVALGSAQGKSVISPVDLVAGATNEANPVVANIAQFLQSLDKDGDPTNGIVIDAAVATAMAGRALDFTLPAATFEPAAQAVVAAVIPGRTLVASAQAQSHLGDTLIGLLSRNYNCTFTDNDGPGGKFTLSIDDGVVTGSGTTTVDSSVETFTVNGTVTSSGTAGLDVSSGGSSTGATWSGTFRTDGTGSGQWSDPPDGGTWSCTKA